MRDAQNWICRTRGYPVWRPVLGTDFQTYRYCIGYRGRGGRAGARERQGEQSLTWIIRGYSVWKPVLGTASATYRYCICTKEGDGGLATGGT